MQPAALSHTDFTSQQYWSGAVRALLPGIALAMILAMLSYLAADWLTALFGPLPVSPIVIALVLGIAIRNLAGIDAIFEPGLQFSQCRILQLGIVLLGIRLSLGEFARVGIGSIPLIVICICSALIIVTRLGRRLGLSPQLSTLIAAGTSICGATAIITTAPIIGARNHEVSYAVACITLFGVVATLAYPLGAHWLFDANPQQAGLFMGTAVHDTAQVVGAGMIYQNLFGTEQALDTATITKLVRNLSMLIVIPALSIRFQRMHYAEHNSVTAQRPHWSKLVPLFVIGFAIMCLIRTIGDLGEKPFGILTTDQWLSAVSTMKAGAEVSLLLAMAALGLNTSLTGLRSIGLKPLGLGLTAAVMVGIISSTLISIFY